MQRWVLDQLKSRFAVHVLSLNELLEDDVQPRDDRNSRLVVQLLLNDDMGAASAEPRSSTANSRPLMT